MEPVQERLPNFI